MKIKKRKTNKHYFITENNITKKYDRITKILGYFVPKSMFDVALKKGKEEWDKISKEGADIGTKVHELINKHITGEQKLDLKKLQITTPLSSQEIKVQNCLIGFLRWEETYRPEYIKTEFFVKDDYKDVGGTCDALVKIQNDKYYIDFKTSKRPSYKHWLQVNMYNFMDHDLIAQMKEGTGHPKNGILYLDKELSIYNFVSDIYKHEILREFEILYDIYQKLNGK